MIQIFVQKSKVTPAEWARAYRKIVILTQKFPLPLLRIEAYNGFTPELDKTHVDLTINSGLFDEGLSFYGDGLSYTSRVKVTLYKEWDVQCEKGLFGEDSDLSKPVSWYPHTDFRDNGLLPPANGVSFFEYYLDTEGALYRYAVIAIGILLEKYLLGKALVVAQDESRETIEDVMHWLSYAFGEDFDMPTYFNKERLYTLLEPHYDDKKSLVGRFEQLYKTEYQQNMRFACDMIGNEPTSRFYAEALSTTRFATFGFYDILDAWIAVSDTLDSVLELLSASKNILAAAGNSDELGRYDYREILNHLLDTYILWDEEERRAFNNLPNNLEYIKTGKEDLWSVMRRMTGNRIDICPFYADQEELFEAFMYHSPQDGAVYQETIDSWIEKNEPKKKEFLALAEKVVQTSSVQIEKDSSDGIETETSKKEFLNRFDESEKFLIEMALRANPAYLEIETLVGSMYGKLEELIEAPENKVLISGIRTDSKEIAVDKIRKRVKELRLNLTISSEFEKEIASEKDMNVLMHIRLLLMLKMPDRILGYTRHQILCDSRYWNQWRE